MPKGWAGSGTPMREVGTLWIGGPLTWLEQVSLKSFVDDGQRITLFSYHDIPNVPPGVVRRDGREIIATEHFLKYERKDSVALFADLFRLHMIRACPGMVWVDTDVYCHRPMTYAGGVVMGFERPDGAYVNNAVLGLPPDHPMLAAMLDFTRDLHPIPPWLGPNSRDAYAAAAAAGAPVPVTSQAWGTWGPRMVSHFARALGMLDQVQPVDAFYPVSFPDRQTFLKPARRVETYLTDRTTALHLWASNKREIGRNHHGLPPPGSYLARLCRRHGIDAAAAPVTGRSGKVFEAGLLDRLGITGLRVVADAGGAARGLTLAAHRAFGAQVDLLDIDAKGHFNAGPTADWIEDYRSFLTTNGVPDTAIRLVRSQDDLRPADLLAAFALWGDTAKIRRIDPVLEHGLAPGGRLVLDIRKGSGAIPHLKPWGRLEAISVAEKYGATVTRTVLVRGAAPSPP
ncbi:MAG: hypothetical protein ACT4OK_14330 [Gemmobacter sp.]